MDKDDILEDDFSAIDDESVTEMPQYTENAEEYDIFEGLEEKHEKHSRGIVFLILIIIAAVGIIIGLSYTNAGLIGTVKQHVSEMFEGTTKFFAGNTEPENKIDKALGKDNLEKETNVMPFENAANAEYAVVNGDVIAAGANYMAKFSSKGKIKWEKTTSIAQPLMDVCGEYIVLAEDGGRGICLFYEDKLLYSIQSASPIFTVDVSERGEVAVAVDKEFFKGGVEVFNKSGRQIFAWSSGTEYVIDAAISKNSRRVAVVLMNTDTKVVSNIQFFDVNKTEGYYTASFDKSAVFSADFIGNVLDVTGDNCIAGLGQDGRTKWYTEFGDKQMRSFGMDNRGNKIISTETNAVPSVAVYAESGNLLTQFETDETPDYVDIMGRSVLYNENRNIFFGVPGREREYTASMDIKELRIISSSAFLVVYNNSIEFIS